MTTITRTRAGWRWAIRSAFALAAFGTLTLPGLAGAAGPTDPRSAPPRPQVAPQVTAPLKRQIQPTPEARSWSSERDDRDWHRGHAGRDDRDWHRGYGGWGYRPYDGPYPYWTPTPVYVPGQWVWNGWNWTWQPGYWIY